MREKPGRARQRAENALRRAEKRRDRALPPCPGTPPGPLIDVFVQSRAECERSDALWVQAVARSAVACEQLASVHERLARAGSGDFGEHCRVATGYRAAAAAFREAVEDFRASPG